MSSSPCPRRTCARLSNSIATRSGSLCFDPKPDGSLPEPVEFKLNEGTTLMLVPADGFALVLGENQVAGSGVSECVVGLMSPSARELEATFERALGGGASVVSRPHQEPWGYSATFRDPDGHTFMLSTAPSAG